MFNSLDHYAHIGREAARAMNGQDWNRYESWRDYASRSYSLEKPEDEREARRAYNVAYRATRSIGA